jgi:hypothetical protein
MTLTPSGAQPMTLSGIFGAPADVDVGKDGVYWVTSDTGAPFLYDPIGNGWHPFGDGVDAVAYLPLSTAVTNTLCFFRGSEVFIAGASAPAPIGQRWPNLPLSFQDGIDGVVSIGPAFYLFRHGQVAFVDFTGYVEVIDWTVDNFDVIVSGGSADPTTYDGNAMFVRGDEVLVFHVSNTREYSVVSGPAPLANYFQGAALDRLSQGAVKTLLCPGPVLATDAPIRAFAGASVYTLESAHAVTAPQESYIADQDPQWPQVWNPRLKQAPAGWIGKLWGVSSAGVPFFSDGTGWAALPLPGNTAATAIDVADNGMLFAIAGSALYTHDAVAGWSQLGSFGVAFQDMAVSPGEVAGSDAFWMCDGQGVLWRYDGNQLAQVSVGAPVINVAANPDGALWHCNGGPNVYRYLTHGSEPAEVINTGQSLASVLRIASTGFGASFFLAQQNGQATLMRFTSAYSVKSSGAYTNGGAPRIAVGSSSVFMYTADPYGAIVAAIDVQIGAEHWRYSYDGATQFVYAPVYDPHHQLVYVFLNSPPQAVALDAATGELRWSLTLSMVISTQPVLAEGLLLLPAFLPIGAVATEIFLTAIDTLDAFQCAVNQQPVVTRWQFSQYIEGSGSTSPSVAPLAPVTVNGTIFWPLWSTLPGTRTLSVYRIDSATGSGNLLFNQSTSQDIWTAIPPVAPIAAPLTLSSGQPELALVACGPDGLYGVSLGADGEWW